MAEDAPPATAPTRILHVERDTRGSRLIGAMLHATEDGLIVSRSGQLTEAVEALRDGETELVLIDVSAFGGDQDGALENLRTVAPEVPVLVLADDASDDAALRAVRAGAQDYLVKAELYPAMLGRAVRFAIERRRLEGQLAHKTLHDPLTGLPNRALFLDRLGVALDRSRRTNVPLAVLFLDVDGFKEINDSLGHSAGDRVLSILAARLRSALRPMDTIARYGGDEFTFLFEDVTSEREVVVIADRINRAARLPLTLETGPTSVSVSIGISVVSDPNSSPETAIQEADVAMYRAKEIGSGSFEIFDARSRRRAAARIELESSLRGAIERRALTVQYQPVYSLGRELQLIGTEALVRWHHPQRGLIAPEEFIPLAEETGLMLSIGEYVLDRALRTLAGWRDLNPDIAVAINVSSRELTHLGPATRLSAAIAASGIDPASLCLEIAERSVTRNPELAVRTLSELAAIGVRVALDDFGIGSLSLENLEQMPLDSLKIHPSFVAGLGTDSRSAAIAGAIVDLGHALGLTVIAEGVETEAQLATLRTLRCDAAQGFLLGRPVDEREMDDLLLTPAGRTRTRRAS